MDLPHIYYTNVTNKTERRQYMESQFQTLGLKYTRLPMEQFPKDGTLFKWYWDDLVGEYSEDTSHYINAYSAGLFIFFQEWIDSTNDEYMILMEDDYDLSLVSRWHFEWGELIERLPIGWDCLQLGFETPYVIPFYLHPTKPEYSLGASLLNRDYIKKLLSLHYPNGKFKFDYNIANAMYIDRESGIHDGLRYDGASGGPDYFINQSGCGYSLPLIPINPYFAGISHIGPFEKRSWEPKLSFVKCHEAYYEWWYHDRDKFTLDDFFTYNKDTDVLMERDISRWDDKYFYDLAMKNNEGILVPTSARDYN